MKSPPLRLAIALVRAWTRLYTWRMEPAIRKARHAEIESDLWEFEQGPDAGRRLSPAVQVMARVLLGVPDDLSWRAAHSFLQEAPLWRTIALTVTTAALVIAALWIFDVMRAQELPHPPARMHFIAAPPPPPPSPPPPPRPR